jgi:hypothetical protein
MVGHPMGRYSPTQASGVAQMRSVAGNPAFGAPADWPYWAPYTSGAFENWARPLIIKVEELWLNCKKVPPDNTGLTFLKSLIGMWNAQHAGSPMRKITIAGTGDTPFDAQIRTLLNTSFPTSFRPPLYWKLMAWQGDPLQTLLGQVSDAQGGNIAITVADPSPTSTGPTALGTTGKVVAGTAAVGGAALVGTAVYALAKGQAIDTVVKAGWTALKGWFVK